MELRDPVTDAAAAKLADFLTTHGGFVIISNGPAAIEVYLTHAHDQVTVSGRFTYFLADPAKPDSFRAQAKAEVTATATVGIADRKVRDVELDSLNIHTFTADGAPSVSAVIFGRAALSLSGPPAEPYTLRVDYDEDWPGSADAGG